jgi:putative transposase
MRRSIDPHGYDPGKKIKGKKRHLLIDTEGLLLLAIIHAANIQAETAGFRQALWHILRKIKVEIAERPDAAKGFSVLPKRGAVERTIGWLNRCRRLAKDWECLNKNARAFVRWASYG